MSAQVIVRKAKGLEDATIEISGDGKAPLIKNTGLDAKKAEPVTSAPETKGAEDMATKKVTSSEIKAQKADRAEAEESERKAKAFLAHPDRLLIHWREDDRFRKAVDHLIQEESIEVDAAHEKIKALQEEVARLGITLHASTDHEAVKRKYTKAKGTRSKLGSADELLAKVHDFLKGKDFQSRSAIQEATGLTNSEWTKIKPQENLMSNGMAKGGAKYKLKK